jgi:hypothetical protein
MVRGSVLAFVLLIQLSEDNWCTFGGRTKKFRLFYNQWKQFNPST